MVVNQRAQRELRKERVDNLLANFDLDMFGLPVVSWRGGLYYIIDGQHRIEAMKQWLGKGWELQKIECRVYQGLNEQQEAEMFDRLNDALSVSAFDKFRVRVEAGRPIETAINDIIRKEKLVISRDEVPGAVHAVGTLVRVYNRADGATLQKALRIIREAFGDAGFEAKMIDGMGHLCQRYEASLSEERVVKALQNVRGGVKGLLGKADVLHRQTGVASGQCVAAAAVEVINANHNGGRKLPSWWKTEKA
jgi:hypothetical protein